MGKVPERAHLLPHNPEAEKAVVGIVLTDSDAYQKVRARLSACDPYSPKHQTILRACEGVSAEGQAINLLTVSDYLTRHGEIEKAGGHAYLSELTDGYITSANLEGAIEIVKRESLKRYVLKAMHRAEAACSNGKELGAVIEALRCDLQLIGQETRPSPEKGLVNASNWLNEEPLEPDQILEDTLDAGDKMAILASSKLWKSFFADQFAMCVAAGRDFLVWKVLKSRRVLLCQFEVRTHHKHRRIKRIARALGITSADLGDRLQILNARGLGISGPAGLERIRQKAVEFQPEVIIFDPLYKLAAGVENAAEDMKVILNAFDQLAEQTGAAIVYVHHDAKGSPGDRDIRDRGAGSNVLGRDYDACLTLTAHAQDTDSAVVEVLLRNYRPIEPFTITWNYDQEDGGYCFRLADDMVPEKKTSKTKATPPVLATYLPIAEAILERGEMEVGSFKAVFKEQAGLPDHRVRAFMNWATAGTNPHLATNEERAKGLHRKMVRLIDGK